MSALPKLHPGRPDFIPAEVFRQWLKPQFLNRHALIDGIQPASFINREERLGRPFKAMGSPSQYRLLDLVARARAHSLSIEPPKEVAAARMIDSLKAEEASLRASIDAARHALSLNMASLSLTNATLLTETEILAGATPYQPRCGVYFLIKHGRVRYVGQSINIEQRIRDHFERFGFDSVAYIPCERGILDKLESLYIHVLRPEWNGRLNTLEGEVPHAPLSLSQLLGATGGQSMASIKAQAFNDLRKAAIE